MIDLSLPSDGKGPHMIQYAYVGYRGVLVEHTENMTDEQVRDMVRMYGAGYPNDRIERFDRCPACEVWTRSGGTLRPNIKCPAVVEALAALRPTGTP
jgi:hypothetical protein